MNVNNMLAAQRRLPKPPPLFPPTPSSFTRLLLYSPLRPPELTLIKEGRVCLLENVFQALPNVPIHLEIKQYSEPEACVHATGNLICKYGRERLTVWGSFSKGMGGGCNDSVACFPPPRTIMYKSTIQEKMWKSVLYILQRLMMPT